MVIDRSYEINGSRLKAQSSKAEGALHDLLSAFSFQLLAVLSDTPEASNARKDNYGRPSPRALRIVMAGGGTGGHLFPGIAMAQEFMARNSDTRIIFVGIGNPLERSVLSKTGYPLQTITVTAIKGRGVWNQLKSIANIPSP